MLLINLSNGKTKKYDLLDEIQCKEIKDLLTKNSFIKKIKAMVILINKEMHSLPLPVKFKNISFKISLLYDDKKQKHSGEMIICNADNIQITLLVYYSEIGPKVSKFSIEKVGKQRLPLIHRDLLNEHFTKKIAPN